MLLFKKVWGTYPIVKNTNPKATKTVYPIICQIVNGFRIKAPTN